MEILILPSNPRRNFLGFLILFYSLQDQSNQPCTPTASTFSLLVTPQTGLNKERRHYLENRQCIFIYILFYFTYICILYALNNIFISHFKNRNEITSFTQFYFYFSFSIVCLLQNIITISFIFYTSTSDMYQLIGNGELLMVFLKFLFFQMFISEQAELVG